MNRHVEKCRGFIAARETALKNAAENQLRHWKGETTACPLLLTAPVRESWAEEIPAYNTKETYWDLEKMLTSNMKSMLGTANGDMDAVPSGRANMGCGIFPTLFPGITSELFDDKMPWVTRHLDKQTLTKMDAGSICIGDDFKRALEHMALLNRTLEGTGAYVFPPDLQGPFDTAHIVYGDAIFYDLYDDMPFMHHLMELSVQAIILGMEETFKVIGGSDRLVAHYNSIVIPRELGGLKISEDTSTLVSPDTIDELIVPYTRRVLRHFGGGYIHYCGKNDHLYKAFIKENLVRAINLGNPEKHDIEAVLAETAQAGKLYYGGLNRLPGEDTYGFFKRVLRASLRDGRFYLLTSAGAADEAQKEEIRDAWTRAQADVRSEAAAAV